MSRSAEEGWTLYEELFDRGVNRIFLKEPHISTDVYKIGLTDKVQTTGEDIDEILIGINRYFRRLAQRQVILAFEQSEKEVTDLGKRTSEGLETAKNNGKVIGRQTGVKIETRKSKEVKKLILKYSRDIMGVENSGGQNTDAEVISIINSKTYTEIVNGNAVERALHVSRNSYYKYKRELLEELSGSNHI